MLRFGEDNQRSALQLHSDMLFLYGDSRYCNLKKNHIYCGKKRKAARFPFSQRPGRLQEENHYESCAGADGCD